ncbi:S-methyl-5-thioribose-1-phosphate isomerase [Calditrichota bacterium]
MSVESRLPERRAIGWYDGKIQFIDQGKLPHDFEVVETYDWRVLEAAIKSLSVRGAPLIGIAAALAVAAFAQKSQQRVDIANVIQQLRRTRPTAVNLFWALDRMNTVLHMSPEADLAEVMLKEALDILQDDEARCAAIGEAGQDVIEQSSRIITVCNTGFLATGGDGTALSIVYKAHDLGKEVHLTACETRPLLQGARLTAWELQQSRIPFQVIVDSAAAGLIRQGEVDVCIIGADRIAKNGDVVNKIGSYQLALACARHNVPYYVAAPFSTVDFDTPNGESIEIEYRVPEEVTSVMGVKVAPEGIKALNPAFDLVPHELIDGIITEKGIYRVSEFEELSSVGE